MNQLKKSLTKIGFNTNDYIVVCIGTQKVYLDSVGPLVGTVLKRKLPDLIVYGILGDNCHALNIETKFNEIHKLYPNKKILAIDACCTRFEEKLGTIEMSKGAIRPGAGVGKNLPAIGDYAIKAFTIEKNCQQLLDDDLLKRSSRRDELTSYVIDIVHTISSAIIDVSNKN